MMKSESLAQAINEEVFLVPYDPEWPRLFLIEHDRLQNLFPHQLLDIQHIGSTAIPGMTAKPIIDILGGVESMAVADALMTPLLSSGYVTSIEFNATLTDRRWFMRHSNGHRTHHLNIVVLSDRDWRRRLSFRDALRTDSDLARRYTILKQELALQYQSDREAYTREKSAFVLSVVGAE